LERKLSSEELQKTRTDLAHVARVTAMGEMAASIAHEVNQPLSAIATYGDACVRLLSADSPNLDKSLEAINHIISDSMRASEVLKRIRSLVKKTDRQNALLDLNEVIREVIALTESDLTRNQTQLRLNLSAEVPAVLGDRIELQQVVLNLVLNSIEAMNDITDRVRELTITSVVNKQGEVVIRVSDSGVGLAPDYQLRIFEHFVTSKPNGLGMGLSISRTIIETHGGRLWAEPNSPHGATFQFSLPAKG
jgi:C4-dicarboxylate-specific signal transduction histidine kinase